MTPPVTPPRHRHRLPVLLVAALLPVVLSACSTVGGSASPGSTRSESAPVLPSSDASAPDPGTTEPATSEPATTEPGTTAPDTTEPDTTPPDTTGPVASDPSDTGPVTPSEPGTTEPSGPGTPEVPGTTTVAPPTGPPASSSGTAPSTDGSVQRWDHFRSPSGNITCLIATGDDGVPSVRCDLGESSIREQHDCNGTGDWGHAVVLDRGRPAAMRCVSDTVADPSVPVLRYGATTAVGPISCTSSEAGMYCSDDTGHGFRLAKASYEVR